jgi:hypothetical protein
MSDPGTDPHRLQALLPAAKVDDPPEDRLRSTPRAAVQKAGPLPAVTLDYCVAALRAT